MTKTRVDEDVVSATRKHSYIKHSRFGYTMIPLVITAISSDTEITTSKIYDHTNH